MLSERHAQKQGVDKEALNNVVFYSLVAFVLAGRLLFAVRHFAAFTSSPLSLIYPNPDLFDPFGGLAAGCITGLVIGQKLKMLLWNTLDALVPFLAVLGLGIGLTHLAAGTAFGQPTGVPWAIQLWNAERHPSQIYEALAGLVILLFIWFSNATWKPGILFVLFAALTAGARLFLEAFRGDSTLITGGFRLAQLGALVVLAVCFALFEKLLRSSANSS